MLLLLSDRHLMMGLVLVGDRLEGLDCIAVVLVLKSVDMVRILVEWILVGTIQRQEAVHISSDQHLDVDMLSDACVILVEWPWVFLLPLV